MTLTENGDYFTCSLACDSKIFAEPLCYRRKFLSLLNLSHNNLSGKAAEQLVTTIASFTALEYLALFNCSLTAKEVKHFAKLSTLTKLKYVNLGCNPIMDKEVATIARLMSSAKQL